METEVKRLVKIMPVARQTPMTNLVENGMYPGVSKYISPVLDKYGSIKTGLTKDDEVRLGSILNVDLARNSSYWHDFTIRVSNKGTILDLDNPLDEVKYLVAKSNPEVANSKDEITGKTIFVLFDEIEEQKKTARKFDYIIEAYKYIAEMSPNDRRSFLKLFGIKSANLVDDGVKTKLKELADDDSKKFCMLYEDKNKEEKMFLFDLIQANILRKSGVAYVYNDEVIGGNEELTLEFLKNKKNQTTVVALKAQLEEKRKFI